MLTRQHKCATTTPAVRRKIQESEECDAALARRFGIHPATVKKWRSRDGVEDLSSKRHYLPSSLSACEEQAVLELRQLGLSLADIVVVMHNINKKLTESSIYRCLKRHGVNKPPAKEDAARRGGGKFAPELPGFIHVDVKHLTRLKGRKSYLYLAIDRATRYGYPEIHYDLKPATAAGFVRRMAADFPCPVRVILSDNGFEWTDRCAGGFKRRATGRHAVDVECARLAVEHRLTKVRCPWTNGMVERMNRHVSEGIASRPKIADNSGRNTFASHAERNAFVMGLIYNHNRTRLKCLGNKTPLQTLHDYAKGYTQAGIHSPPAKRKDFGVKAKPVNAMDSRFRRNDGVGRGNDGLGAALRRKSDHPHSGL